MDVEKNNLLSLLLCVGMFDFVMVIWYTFVWIYTIYNVHFKFIRLFAFFLKFFYKGFHKIIFVIANKKSRKKEIVEKTPITLTKHLNDMWKSKHISSSWKELCGNCEAIGGLREIWRRYGGAVGTMMG